MSDASADDRTRLLDAALAHVPFDGWSDTALAAAMAETGIPQAVARSYFPRGGVDLALAHHRRGDEEMVRRLAATDLSALRFRDKVATAVRLRIEAAGDREIVRRGSTLFALPQNAGDGARALWGTADAIWSALGDTSDDYNWYTKRATLSGVYGATVLFWLGDDSPEHRDTWAFLDRRIEDVMRIEKVKAQVRETPLVGPLAKAAESALGKIRAPTTRDDLPGRWRSRREAAS